MLRFVSFAGPVEPIEVAPELDGRVVATDGDPPKNPPNNESVPVVDFGAAEG